MLLSIYAELMDSQSEEMHGWEGSPELIIDELFEFSQGAESLVANAE